MDKNNGYSDDALTLVKELTSKDFLDIGKDQVAYIKQLAGTLDNPFSYAVYAADGSQISIMESYDMAVAAIRVNDLFPVTVH